MIRKYWLPFNGTEEDILDDKRRNINWSTENSYYMEHLTLHKVRSTLLDFADEDEHPWLFNMIMKGTSQAKSQYLKLGKVIEVDLSKKDEYNNDK